MTKKAHRAKTNVQKSRVDTTKRHRTQIHHFTSLDDYEQNARELDRQLKLMGLYCKDTEGDGNCLFRALSDQYKGDDSNHKTYRAIICDYIQKNAEEFRHFVEDDQSLEEHLTNMCQLGTYGGNMELVAFAKRFEVNVKVYQPGYVYVIKGNDSSSTQTLHIAYHSWEHYSSIRNIDGPHTGLPEINTLTSTLPTKEESLVLRAVPGVALEEVKEVLSLWEGDLDTAIEVLYERRFQAQEEDKQKVEGEKEDKGENDEEKLVKTVKKEEKANICHWPSEDTESKKEEDCSISSENMQELGANIDQAFSLTVSTNALPALPPSPPLSDIVSPPKSIKSKRSTSSAKRSKKSKQKEANRAKKLKSASEKKDDTKKDENETIEGMRQLYI